LSTEAEIEGKITVKFYLLSYNLNAIQLLKENKEKINWRWLSLNPNAIEILKENLENH
jgi:hypothetical protein